LTEGGSAAPAGLDQCIECAQARASYVSTCRSGEHQACHGVVAVHLRVALHQVALQLAARA